MLVIQEWEATCKEMGQPEASELFRQLDQAGYGSVTWSILRGVSSVVGDTEEEGLHEYQNPAADGTPILADMFLPEQECVLHLLVTKLYFLGLISDRSSTVKATAVFETDKRPEIIDSFLDDAARLLKELGLLTGEQGFEEPKTSDSCGEVLGSLPGLVVPDSPPAVQVKAALALDDKGNRDLIIDVRTKDIAYLHDFVGAKGGSAPVTDQATIDNLVSRGLLEVEFAALCRKNSEPLLRGTKPELTQSLGRCPRCDKLLKDEHIVEVVRATPLSDVLVLKSRWMQILAVTTLIFEGLAPEDIRVPPQEAGSDALDLAFCFDNRSILVELKADDFSAGHAAQFAARLKASKTNIGLVACTGSVLPEAHTFLEEIFPSDQTVSPFLGPAPQRYEFLEGPGCVTLLLSTSIKMNRMVNAAVSMRLYGAGAGISPFSIIWNKLGRPKPTAS